MAKRREQTLGGIKHGVVSHPDHQLHQKQNKKRAAKGKKTAYLPYEIADPQGHEPFKSDVSLIGGGRNWIVRRGRRLIALDGDTWIEMMVRLGRANASYQGRQVRKGKVGYYRRKVRDRMQLSETDKNLRPESDVTRETIDLRPDHSRALSMLLRDARHAHKLEPALAAIRAEKIRLFEEIYRRWVLGVGEHPDSGQYHHDLWHTGIRKTTVADDGGTEIGGLVAGGATKNVRLREPFRAYGVGVGVASWDRHRRALVEHGVKADEIMGKTLEVLKRNSARALKQNNEEPRDLRMWKSLDEFVDRTFREIDPLVCDQARDEYVQWITTGYSESKLGVRLDTKKERKLKERVASLEQEVAELKRELSGVEAIMDKIREIVKLIKETTGIEELLGRLEGLWQRLHALFMLTEREPKPVESPTAIPTDAPQETPASELNFEEPSASGESAKEEIVMEKPVAGKLAAVEADADEPTVGVTAEGKEPTASDSIMTVDDAEVGAGSTATEDLGAVEHSPVIATAELLIVEEPVAEELGVEKLAVEEPAAAEVDVEAPVVLSESVSSLEPATDEPAESSAVNEPVVLESIARNPLEKEITAIPNQSTPSEVDATPKKPTWKPKKWVDDKDGKTM
jgi:hypothetical protein